MSDAADMPDGPSLLAAEYVLGTLDTAELAQADAQRLADPAFAAEIHFWEARLSPLTVLAAPIPPPAALWARIEDSTAGASAMPTSVPAPRARPANDNALRFWRAAALGGLAVAASLAAFILLRPVPTPVFAVLAPIGNTASLLVALGGADGSLRVRPTAALQIAAGHDLELWSLPPGATRPDSLGLLHAGRSARLPAGLAPGTQILVSLEQTGGSPTGLPVGPVVYGGTLLRAE